MLGPGFAQKVVEEVNKIRLNPKTYSNKIRGYLSCFQGNVLRIPKQPGLMTQEGPTAYREAADFLLSLPKLQPLSIDNGLTSVAQEMATELSHYEEFEQMNEIDRDSIIEKYGHDEGQFGESTDFGSMTPEMVVINLLVDDGDKNRSNRKMLFKETYRKIGCGCAPHSTYKSVTVIMFATNFIAGAQKPKLIKTGKTTLSYGQGTQQQGGNISENIKDIKTEQDVNNSGIPYRYVNNVDPNKDLITDSAKYGGPLKVTKEGKVNFEEEQTQSGNMNPNYRQKLDLSGNGTTKVGGGGSILNTNVESSGWVTDFEKKKGPEYWRAKQEYQDNYRGMAPIGPAIGNVGGGGPIGNTNVESTDWNDYSGYERRIPLYHEEKKYDAPTKEERFGMEPPREERGYGYAQESVQGNNNQNFPDMSGVTKVETSEKIINEGGRQIKLTKMVKYMENGEIKTEITKSKI